MGCNLTIEQVDAAIPAIQQGLEKYLWLQYRVTQGAGFHRNSEFRRKFNYFYKVRKNLAWREAFYETMRRANEEKFAFAKVLAEIRDQTGCFEPSFASKLVATLDTAKPVIDRFVLKNLNLRIPSRAVQDRLIKTCYVYEKLAEISTAYLSTTDGEYLVHEFSRTYPNANISREKMLDLVLWQTRGN